MYELQITNSIKLIDDNIEAKKLSSRLEKQTFMDPRKKLFLIQV